MLIVKIIENNAMYSVQEHHLYLFSSSVECNFVKVMLASFVFSIFSVPSSINLSTNSFLHLQFSQSKYSPASHDLSHSHSQLLGFQINPLSHIPLSSNSLHSHLHLSSFQCCLLLQTRASNLHLHLHVLLYSMCLVSLVLAIRLETVTFKFFATLRTPIFAYGSLILLHPPLHLLILMLKE